MEEHVEDFFTLAQKLKLENTELRSNNTFIFLKLKVLHLDEINDNKLQWKLIYKEFGFDVFNSEVKSQIDVIVCMNGEFMQRNFAINLVDTNHKIYEKSEGKITGILLEKSKKKYYNIDIDILIKSLLLTFEEIVTDKNKLAKIAIMFMQDSNAKFRNLRLIFDFLFYLIYV